MKAQLAALAIAATLAGLGSAVAVTGASAAGVAGSPHVSANWPGSSWDQTPQAELTYLRQVCPAVKVHPGAYNATLDRFCAEIR